MSHVRAVNKVEQSPQSKRVPQTTETVGTELEEVNAAASESTLITCTRSPINAYVSISNSLSVESAIPTDDLERGYQNLALTDDNFNEKQMDSSTIGYIADCPITQIA